MLREALPNRQQHGVAWYSMDFLALRAALVGRLDDAARLLGYTDACHAANRVQRQVNEARARARVDELLRRSIPGATLQRLMTAGAELDGEAACALALAG